jgi:hypothetical protein
MAALILFISYGKFTEYSVMNLVPGQGKASSALKKVSE